MCSEPLKGKRILKDDFMQAKCKDNRVALESIVDKCMRICSDSFHA